jgi:hypothetical protein
MVLLRCVLNKRLEEKMAEDRFLNNRNGHDHKIRGAIIAKADLSS